MGVRGGGGRAGHDAVDYGTRTMATETLCPHCSKRYVVNERHVGRSVTCKGCGRPFTVESPGGPERTPAGVPVYRPQPVGEAGQSSAMTTPYVEQISRHIEETIGPAPSVFREIVSAHAHIDLHIVPPQPHVAPGKDRPLGGDYITIVTSGMSWRPMNVPPEAKQSGVSDRAELMLALPKTWPGFNADGTFGPQMMKDDARWWPIRWLKQMARIPHQYGTFFGHGVTVPNGQPARPFVKGSQLCGWMVFHPLLCPAARQLQIGEDVRIDFFALFALTGREMELKSNQGLSALTQALAEGEVFTELLDPARRSTG